MGLRFSMWAGPTLVLRKSADAGHAYAMSMLGILLTKQGKNAEAEQWYRKAADAGQVNGMYNLGSC